MRLNEPFAIYVLPPSALKIADVGDDIVALGRWEAPPGQAQFQGAVGPVNQNRGVLVW